MHSQRGYPSSPNGLNWFVTILLELLLYHRDYTIDWTIKLFQCPITRKTILTVLPFSICLKSAKRNTLGFACCDIGKKKSAPQPALAL
jgi:hypothetical protein